MAPVATAIEKNDELVLVIAIQINSFANPATQGVPSGGGCKCYGVICLEPDGIQYFIV